MGRKKVKEWQFIGEITENWVAANYPTAQPKDSWKYKDTINTFFEWMGLTETEFMEGYKRAKDRREWAQVTGKKLVAFYNYRKKKGYATNTVRSEVSKIRAFCRDNCTTLIIQRRKIGRPTKAKDEHEFTREELAKMFYVADVRDKAILSTAISLGYSIQDFSELPRSLIESLVDKAIQEKIDFIGFDYQREKTHVESRSHLTPEARESLKAWFDYIDKKRETEGKTKTEWVWCNGNNGRLSDQAINDVIKNLVKKANIITTGKIKFHLLRKFLMNALHDANFSSWEVKRIIGKQIATSDATYLQGLNRKVSEKFHQVYEFIRLTGYANKNGLKAEEQAQKIQQLEISLEQEKQDKLTLYQILQYTIPRDNLINAISQIMRARNIQKEDLKAMATTTEGETEIENMSNEKLVEVLKALVQQQQKQQA